MRKLLLATIVGAAVAALALTVGLYAQPIGQNTLSGNECWNAGQGPGGVTTGFICVNTVRNTTGYQVISSASGTVQPSVNVNTLAVNAQPAASTAFTTPALPVPDGQLFQVCNVTAAAWATNASTLSAASGQTIQGGAITTTTLGAHNCVELIYQLSSTTWFQIR